MSFEIKFSNQAAKFIRRLSENIKERIKAKFHEVAKDPFRYLEHYEGDNCYKLRISDFKTLIYIYFSIWINVKFRVLRIPVAIQVSPI